MTNDQSAVYEVTLDANGVAHRVPNGQGTHFIHVSEESETHLEEKVCAFGCFFFLTRFTLISPLYCS